MRRTIKYIIIILAVAVVSECTRNNGDIGVYFGTWQLESVTINGQIDETYSDGNVFWKFQNTIISMVRSDFQNHTSNTSYGMWEEDGKKLILDFTYSDDSNKAGSAKYSPLAETYLPANAISTLDIISQSGSNMTLQYTAEDGNIYGYSLKKQ